MLNRFLALLVLTLVLSTPSQATGGVPAAVTTPAVFQLDVCNKHRTVSEAPGTSLTVTKDGMCIVTSQVLAVPAAAAAAAAETHGTPAPAAAAPACKASTASTAVLLRFPCQEQQRLKQAAGPALNLWGSFEGAATLQKSLGPNNKRAAAIITEAAPKPQSVSMERPKQSLHAANKAARAAANTTTITVTVSTGAAPAAAAPAAAGAAGAAVRSTASGNSSSSSSSNSSSGSSSCSFLTLHPGLYYHKSPPLLTYGYVVSGVVCEAAASAQVVTSELERRGAQTFPTTYGLWLKPSLPMPPASMSGEQQSCNLVVTVLTRSYVSSDTYPCSMRVMQPQEVQDGCCYNAGGMGRRRRSLLGFWGMSSEPHSWPAGRQLLSSWERAVWTRRALQL